MVSAPAPRLGYNAALYEFSPSEALYPMGPLDKEKYAQAINSIKADAEGATFLPRAIRDIEPVLQGASGKTVVFIFSDGSFSEIGPGMKDPGDITTELAEKYNVCFYVIGDGTSTRAQKRLRDMAKSNECSRLLSFAKFVENPQYNTGALYIVKTTSEVQTLTEMKAAGAAGGRVDQADVAGLERMRVGDQVVRRHAFEHHRGRRLVTNRIGQFDQLICIYQPRLCIAA